MAVVDIILGWAIEAERRPWNATGGDASPSGRLALTSGKHCCDPRISSEDGTGAPATIRTSRRKTPGETFRTLLVVDDQVVDPVVRADHEALDFPACSTLLASMPSHASQGPNSSHVTT